MTRLTDNEKREAVREVNFLMAKGVGKMLAVADVRKRYRVGKNPLLRWTRNPKYNPVLEGAFDHGVIRYIPIFEAA